MKTFILSLLALTLIFAACSRENAEGLFEQAQSLEEQGKPEEALALYERVFTDFQDSVEAPAAMFRAAQLYFQLQNDPLKAATTYEVISEQYPDDRLGHQALFVAAFTYADHLQNYSKAKVLYEKYIAVYPDSSMAATAQFELEHLGMTPEQVLSQQQEQAQ